MYLLGITLGVVTLFAPPRPVGIPTGIASMPLQFLPSVVTLLGLRYDLVRLLVRTYEFWYLSLTNLLVLALFSVCFGDARALVIVGASTAFKVALFADANDRARRTIVLATALGALINVVFITASTFKYLPFAQRDVQLVQFKGRSLNADDVIANAVITIIILLLRNGVRMPPSRVLATTTDAKPQYKMVQCVALRCHLELRPVAPSLPPPPPNGEISLNPPTDDTRLSAINIVPAPPQGARTMLEFVRISDVFHAGQHGPSGGLSWHSRRGSAPSRSVWQA
ncbi:hypothetical protein PINS_up004383 [Pythium insidiosum]|nr:hypothetical protein PINS_up004383 [Pythium insidiosum]